MSQCFLTHFCVSFLCVSKKTMIYDSGFKARATFRNVFWSFICNFIPQSSGELTTARLKTHFSINSTNGHAAMKSKAHQSKYIYKKNFPFFLLPNNQSPPSKVPPLPLPPPPPPLLHAAFQFPEIILGPISASNGLITKCDKSCY